MMRFEGQTALVTGAASALRPVDLATLPERHLAVGQASRV